MSGNMRNEAYTYLHANLTPTDIGYKSFSYSQINKRVKDKKSSSPTARLQRDNFKANFNKIFSEEILENLDSNKKNSEKPAIKAKTIFIQKLKELVEKKHKTISEDALEAIGNVLFADLTITFAAKTIIASIEELAFTSEPYEIKLNNSCIQIIKKEKIVSKDNSVDHIGNCYTILEFPLSFPSQEGLKLEVVYEIKEERQNLIQSKLDKLNKKENDVEFPLQSISFPLITEKELILIENNFILPIERNRFSRLKKTEQTKVDEKNILDLIETQGFTLNTRAFKQLESIFKNNKITLNSQPHVGPVEHQAASIEEQNTFKTTLQHKISFNKHIIGSLNFEYIFHAGHSDEVEIHSNCQLNEEALLDAGMWPEDLIQLNHQIKAIQSENKGKIVYEALRKTDPKVKQFPLQAVSPMPTFKGETDNNKNANGLGFLVRDYSQENREHLKILAGTTANFHSMFSESGKQGQLTPEDEVKLKNFLKQNYKKDDKQIDLISHLINEYYYQSLPQLIKEKYPSIPSEDSLPTQHIFKINNSINQINSLRSLVGTNRNTRIFSILDENSDLYFSAEESLHINFKKTTDNLSEISIKQMLVGLNEGEQKLLTVNPSSAGFILTIPGSCHTIYQFGLGEFTSFCSNTLLFSLARGDLNALTVQHLLFATIQQQLFDIAYNSNLSEEIRLEANKIYQNAINEWLKLNRKTAEISEEKYKELKSVYQNELESIQSKITLETLGYSQTDEKENFGAGPKTSPERISSLSLGTSLSNHFSKEWKQANTAFKKIRFFLSIPSLLLDTLDIIAGFCKDKANDSNSILGKVGLNLLWFLTSTFFLILRATFSPFESMKKAYEWGEKQNNSVLGKILGGTLALFSMLFSLAVWVILSKVITAAYGVKLLSLLPAAASKAVMFIISNPVTQTLAFAIGEVIKPIGYGLNYLFGVVLDQAAYSLVTAVVLQTAAALKILTTSIDKVFNLFTAPASTPSKQKIPTISEEEKSPRPTSEVVELTKKQEKVHRQSLGCLSSLRSLFRDLLNIPSSLPEEETLPKKKNFVFNRPPSPLPSSNHS